MRVLIEVVLWLAVVVFGIDGGFGYLSATAKMPDADTPAKPRG